MAAHYSAGKTADSDSGMAAQVLERIKAGLHRGQSAPSDPARPARRGGLLKKIAIALAIFLVLFAVIGFFVVPPLAKSYAVKRLSADLQRPVAIESIRANPFALTLSVKGFVVTEPNGEDVFLSLDELFLNLSAMSLMRRAPVLTEIRLDKPYAHLVRLEPKTYNFSDILDRWAAQPAKPAPESPPRFSLNNIRVLDGRIEFDDRPKHNQHALTELNVAIPFISNLPYLADKYVQPALSAKANGTPFSIEGQTKPFKESLETTVDVAIETLELPKYIEYVPVDLNFKLTSGVLDTGLTFSFIRYEGKPPAFTVRGSVGLEKLALTEPDGRPLFNLAALDVPVDGIDVFARKFDFGVIALSSPEVFVRRTPDGVLNWLGVVPRQESAPAAAAEKEPSKADGSTFQLNVAEVKVTDGQIHVEDHVPGKGFLTDLSGVEASVQKLHLPQSEPAQITASLVTKQGETVRHQSTFLLDPLTSEGTVEVSQLRLKTYEPYFEPYILYTLEDGTADLSTKYLYRAAPTPQFSLSDFNLGLASVRFRKRGADEDFLRAKTAQIRNASVDLEQLVLLVGEFSTRDGFLNVVREADGAFNVTRILPAPKEVNVADVQGAPPQQVTPWRITLARADIQRWKVAYTDLSMQEPVKAALDGVTLKASGLSNDKSRKAAVAFQAGLEKGGRIAANGRVALNPVDADLKIALKNFDFVPLQPYFTEQVNILITSGEASTDGDLTLQIPPGGPPRLAFRGAVSVTNFASVDKVNNEDFLNWNTLFLTGISTTSNPFSLDIQEVALSEFYSRLIIYPDGHLNVRDAAAARPGSAGGKTAAPVSGAAAVATAGTTPQGGAVKSAEGTKLGGPPASAQPAPRQAALAPSASVKMPPIKIAKVTLQGGTVDFTDLFIKPNYSANLTQIGGAVTGLSSELNTTADVELRGRYARTAPVEIKGKVNPLVQNLFLDLAANVKDIELGPFSPYSGKYVGYAIQKGKMSFDVAYLVQDRKLAAKNRLVLDQLTFGEKVQSPQATKLPVLLAVSLLKDRNGVIDVNLPISGSIDDPKFSIGGIVWQVILNLLEKIVTAPFALIGSLFGGGGEELSFVEFEYGRATLTTADQDKVNKLRSALTERPGLKLDITGHADPEKDREGLRRFRFEQQVNAQKLKDLVKQGSSVKLDQVKVEPQEYEKYLKRAYKEAKFPKPRNAIGITKDLPNEEMEKLMVTNVQVTDDDLIALANERAQAAKEAITQGGAVGVERVFLLAPKVEAGKADEKQKSARADFSLKS